jgi:hypothetical protein
MADPLDFIRYLLQSPARRHEPDDVEDNEIYQQFLDAYLSDDEMRSRNAARRQLFELGFSSEKAGICTDLPVVVYFDSDNAIISHEIYRGRLPAYLMKRKWDLQIQGFDQK